MMMLSDFFNTKTLSFIGNDTLADFSYRSGPGGQYMLSGLLDLSEINTDEIDLGEASWVEKIEDALPEELAQLFSGLFSGALESAAVGNGEISIGEMVSVACSSINVTHQNQGAGRQRLSLEFFSGPGNKRTLFLDIGEEGGMLSEASFSGDLTLSGLAVNLVALYNTDEGWELQLKTQAGESVALPELLEKFIEVINLPAGLPGFELSDLLLVSHPGSGSAYLQSRVNGSWNTGLFGKSFGISNMQMQLEMADNTIGNVALSGELTLYNVESAIIATLDLRTGTKEFTITTPPGETIGFSAFTQALPDALLPGIVEDVQLSDLVLYYNTGNDDYNYAFKMSGFRLMDIFDITAAEAALSPAEKRISGQLAFSDTLNINILAVENGGGNWFFEGYANITPSISIADLIEEVAAKLGIGEGIDIPEEIDSLLTIEDIYLSYDTGSEGFALKLNRSIAEFYDLEFYYNKRTGEYEFRLNTFPDTIIIIKDQLEIRELSLTANTDEKSLKGTLTLMGSTEHELTINLSAVKKNTDASEGLWFKGETGEGEQISIGKLVEDIAFTFGTDAAIPEEVENWKLANLTVSYHTGNKSFSLAFEGQFTIGGREIETQITLVVEEVNGVWQKSYEAAFNLNIGGFNITLQAQKEETGWLFKGNTAEDIPIGSLIEDMAGQFGGENILPEVLNGLSVQGLGISYYSGNNSFTFNGTVRFPVGSRKKEIQLVIGQKQQDGSYRNHFSGALPIGERNFEINFSQSAQSNMLLATYHKEGGDEIVLKDIVSLVSPNLGKSIPEALAITLNGIFLLISRDAEGGSKYLFGFQPDLEMDLAAIIGSALGGQSFPEMRLSGSQLSVASDQFSPEEIKDINQLLPPEINPLNPPVLSGPSLGFTLDLAALKIPLNIPMGAGKSSLATGIASLESGSGSTGNNQTAAQELPAPTSDANAHWLNIKKRLGPVYISRIGFRSDAGTLWLLFDASLHAGPVKLYLAGLSIATSLKEGWPQLRLDGLGLNYTKGPIKVTGAFLRETDKEGTDAYNGLAIIKTAKLSIAALGAYKELDGQPSIFVYAAMNMAVGAGPPFFQLTGISAGFGYNRTLNIPEVSRVKEFPLVSVVSGANDYGFDPLTVLGKIGHYIPAAKGKLFFAFGLQFTSFKMINTFALMLLRPDDKIRLDLLGISTLTVPANSSNPLAKVELQLKAAYDFYEGSLKVEGELTDSSYVLSKKCKLTGGFAFYSWFDGPHAGDFVYTMGGYHPDFKAPAHYPRVPRLGFHWQVIPELSIKGNMYYALTPNTLMAGGRLEATFEIERTVGFDIGIAGADLTGKIRAWFILGADFIIAWQPYYYQAKAEISVGIEVTFRGQAQLFWGVAKVSVEKSFSLSLGAGLTIWGPEFAGIAHVDWSIVSFDIKFGSDTKEPDPLTWEQFKTAFLPEDSAICTLAVEDGLTRQQEDGSYVVSPTALVITTNSVIPVKEARLSGTGFTAWTKSMKTAIEDPVREAVLERALEAHNNTYKTRKTSFGVGTMDVSEVSETTHTIKITDTDNNHADVTDDFIYEPILKSAPEALWGSEFDTRLNSNTRLINNMLTGFRIVPKPKKKPDITEDKPVSDFSYDIELKDNAYNWAKSPDKVLKKESDAYRRKSIQDISDTAVTQKRTSILEGLGLHTSEINKVKLNNIANDTEDAFLVAPELWVKEAI